MGKSIRDLGRAASVPDVESNLSNAQRAVICSGSANPR